MPACLVIETVCEMLDLSPLMVSDETSVSTDVLLLHTVGAAAEATVAGILVYALNRIRRNGEIPRGFVPIAVLISLGSLGRLIGMSLSWSEHAVPFWLEITTLSILLITILSVPIVLSAHYGSSETLAIPNASRTGLQWVMIGNIGAIIAGFLLAAVYTRRRCCLGLLRRDALSPPYRWRFRHRTPATCK